MDANFSHSLAKCYRSLQCYALRECSPEYTRLFINIGHFYGAVDCQVSRLSNDLIHYLPTQRSLRLRRALSIIGLMASTQVQGFSKVKRCTPNKARSLSPYGCFQVICFSCIQLIYWAWYEHDMSTFFWTFRIGWITSAERLPKFTRESKFFENFHWILGSP